MRSLPNGHDFSNRTARLMPNIRPGGQSSFFVVAARAGCSLPGEAIRIFRTDFLFCSSTPPHSPQFLISVFRVHEPIKFEAMPNWRHSFPTVVARCVHLCPRMVGHREHAMTMQTARRACDRRPPTSTRLNWVQKTAISRVSMWLYTAHFFIVALSLLRLAVPPLSRVVCWRRNA